MGIEESVIVDKRAEALAEFDRLLSTVVSRDEFFDVNDLVGNVVAAHRKERREKYSPEGDWKELLEKYENWYLSLPPCPLCPVLVSYADELNEMLKPWKEACNERLEASALEAKRLEKVKKEFAKKKS